MLLLPISLSRADQAFSAALWTEEKNRLLCCCTFGVCLWIEPRCSSQTGIPTTHDKLSRNGESKARISCWLWPVFCGGSPLWVNILSMPSKENCELSVAHLTSKSSSRWPRGLVLVSVQPGLDVLNGEQLSKLSKSWTSMLCFLSKSVYPRNLGYWGAALEWCRRFYYQK